MATNTSFLVTFFSDVIFSEKFYNTKRKSKRIKSCQKNRNVTDLVWEKTAISYLVTSQNVTGESFPTSPHVFRF